MYNISSQAGFGNQRCCGSTMDFGATSEGKGLTLWRMLQHFYKEQKIRSDELKLDPLQIQAQNTCSQPQAATIWKLAPWLRQLFRVFDHTIEERRMVMAGMVALGESHKRLSKDCFFADYLKQQAAIVGRQDRGTQTQIFWSGYLRKTSVCPSKPRETKPFGGISRDFCRDVPGVPDMLEKMCVQSVLVAKSNLIAWVEP